MAEFKKIEHVDAFEFTGGVQNGSDLVFWISSNNGRAEWTEAKGKFLEMITIKHRGYRKSYVFEGDWIVMNADGSFTGYRPELFLALYEPST